VGKSLDEILLPAMTWLAPVSAGAPGGTDAKFLPLYEQARAEMAKLESPRGEIIDWPAVIKLDEELLATKAKDFTIASQAAFALYHTRGLDGLLTGVAFLATFIEQYWETGFPPKVRVKGRASALEWFVEHATLVATIYKSKSSDRTALESFPEQITRLREVAAARYAAAAPALTPLTEAIERLIIQLPKEKPPAPPKPAGTASATPAGQSTPAGAEESAPAGDAASATSSGAAMPATPVAGLTTTDAEDVTKFLRGIGQTLVDAGAALRKAQPFDPTAYRLIRAGMWLHISRPPPIADTGKTLVPGLAPALRTKLEALAAGQSWQGLLEEAEAALLTNRLNIDLQRYAFKALRGLGDATAGARQAVAGELRNLLERVPGMLQVVCADGTRLADEPTKEWLNEEVLLKAGSKGAADTESAEAPALPPELVASAKKLADAGKIGEAMALLQPAVGTAHDARARFRARLAQADMCRRAGATRVAQPMYESLDAESTARELDSWEPHLVVSCLVGYLACLRVNAKNPGESQEKAKRDEPAIFSRLAQLQPSIALELTK